jgi:hypothetical protein
MLLERWNQKWGCRQPQNASQTLPSEPQAIKGLENGVWDGHRLICRIGGYCVWNRFTNRIAIRECWFPRVRTLDCGIGVYRHVYELRQERGWWLAAGVSI